MTQLFTKSLLITVLFGSSLWAQSWQPLFDGHSFDGWTQANGSSVEAPAWEIVDGMLHLDRSKGAGGNLLTERKFGDFELSFEWKVARQANNGIKYRVADFDGRVLGLEYQVIDDGTLPQLKPNHKTASIYDIYDVPDHNLLRPAGEFNRGRIVVRHDRIEHWLNGCRLTVAYVGSDEWNQRIAASKFSDVEGFGTIQIGHIMITDHKDEVWYRNIYVRDLSAQTQCPPRSRRRVITKRRGLLRRILGR